MNPIANRDTAVRRLSKRAEWVGMSLDRYLRACVYVSDGRYWLNDNLSMQMCWLRLGCPANADEVAFALPRCDSPLRPRPAGDAQ